MLDLSLVSMGLLNICSKMSIRYYKIVLFRDNFCLFWRGQKYQNPTIWTISIFLQFIAVCQMPCGSFEKTKEIYGCWDVVTHNCTMNCCQRKVNCSHLCIPWREVLLVIAWCWISSCSNNTIVHFPIILPSCSLNKLNKLLNLNRVKQRMMQMLLLIWEIWDRFMEKARTLGSDTKLVA